MVCQSSKRACLLVATVAALALGAAPARAEFVTSIGGNEALNNFQLVHGGPSGPVGAQLSLYDIDDAVTSINGVTGQYSNQPGGSVLDGGGGPPLTVAGFTTEADGTRYMFGEFWGAHLSFRPNFGGGFASFVFGPLTGFVPNANTSLMEFSAEIDGVYCTNTLYDFSGIASGGLFRMDIRATAVH